MALTVAEQHRDQVCQLLTQAITMLCKNLMTFRTDLCIEGLIGVTTDSTNVILVNIKETVTSTAGPENDASVGGKLDQNDTSGRLNTSNIRHRPPSDGFEFDESTIVPEEKSNKNEERTTAPPTDFRYHQESIKQEFDVLPRVSEYDGSQPEVDKTGYSSENIDVDIHTFSTLNADGSENAKAGMQVSPLASIWLPWTQTNDNLHLASNQDVYEVDERLLSRPNPTSTLSQFSRVTGTSRALIKPCKRISNRTAFDKDGRQSFAVKRDGSGAEIFVCECGESFRHRSSLYRHQMMHLGKAFRCDLCGIVMTRKDNLLTHKRRHVNEQLNAKFLKHELPNV